MVGEMSGGIVSLVRDVYGGTVSMVGEVDITDL